VGIDAEGGKLWVGKCQVKQERQKAVSRNAENRIEGKGAFLIGERDRIQSPQGKTADACGRPAYAGPVEATAIGNIACQAIAAGELKNVAEAREVVRNSFDIECYEPQNSEAWDEAYERFKTLIEK
jgi:hypothetical protein